MNGQELDQILRLEKTAWLEMSEPERSWHLFKLSRFYIAQPQRCIKQFITRKQILIIAGVFLTGAGVMNIDKLIMFLRLLI